MLYVAQQKHFPILLRQARHGLGQQGADFASFECFGRNFPPVGEIPWRVGSFFIRQSCNRFEQVGVLLSLTHAGFVRRDLDQPGTELRLAAKLPQVGKGLQNGVLRNILRIRVVSQQGQRGHVNPAFVRLHQRSEQGTLSLTDTGDERWLAVITSVSGSLDNRHSQQHLDFENGSTPCGAAILSPFQGSARFRLLPPGLTPWALFFSPLRGYAPEAVSRGLEASIEKLETRN